MRANQPSQRGGAPVAEKPASRSSPRASQTNIERPTSTTPSTTCGRARRAPSTACGRARRTSSAQRPPHQALHAGGPGGRPVQRADEPAGQVSQADEPGGRQVLLLHVGARRATSTACGSARRTARTPSLRELEALATLAAFAALMGTKRSPPTQRRDAPAVTTTDRDEAHRKHTATRPRTRGSISLLSPC